MIRILSGSFVRSAFVALAALTVISTGAFAQSSAGVPSSQLPYAQVRALQTLQEQVAQGNTHAMKAQRQLLGEMDENFAALSADVWQDPRNARAAVIHLLSGGHPKVVRQLLTIDPAPAIDRALMEAAVAYVEGREEDMRILLEDIDPLDLPASLGGHVALVKAVPYVRTDPAKAMRLLQVASLLMPGTLVEEAALRREVFVAGMMGDVERFRVLSIRYLRRFRSSSYSGDFRRRFAIALDTLGFVQSEDKFALLNGVLHEFDADSRRGLYLRLARSALLGGNLVVARKATEEAKALSVEGTKEHDLLKIYRVATRLDPEAMQANRDLLWSIDPASLSPEDRDFLDGVYTVFNSVRHFPGPPPGVIGEFNTAINMADPPERDWLTDDMELAERLLRRTEKSLSLLGEEE
ncbi:chemotaxis protein [Roseibium denhamense]|uniref:Chemotaxis protein MotC n=1 Tax=Roseibium denhamense TaxID=76305 RepID=A0ABY1PF16_9HYPH|nr:chemotaxis protein [Roseibium denhamense]MTI06244.1 chemotaxis protein [Roseibium denhamense]SMP32758.1 chemotaxis protein MotC [Roseibium denhamense]